MRSLNGVAAAERFLSAAIELWPAEDPELASLLLSRAKTRRAAGPIAGAVSDAELALTLVGEDPEREAEALLVLAGACWFAGRGIEAGEHGSRAAVLVRDLPDSRVKAEVLVEQARLVMLAGGDPDTVVELAGEGLALSEALGLEQLQANALATRGAVVRDVADLERAAQIAEQCKAIGAFQRAVNNRQYLDYVAGRLGDIDSSLAKLREFSQRFGFTSNLRWIDGTEVQHGLMFGTWDAALELAEQLTAFDAAGEHDVMSANAYAVRAHIRHARGLPGWREDADRATAYAQEDGGQVLPVLLCMHARLLALEGERPAAARLVDEIEAFLADRPRPPHLWESAVLFAFVALGRLDSYRTLLERSPDRPSLWIDAASAVLDGDFTAAADVYGGMGARRPRRRRAYTPRARCSSGAMRPDRRPSSPRAIAFYREVGATALIREAETLLPATA